MSQRLLETIVGAFQGTVNVYKKACREANSEMKFFSRVFQGIFCQSSGVFQGIFDYVFEKYNYHIQISCLYLSTFHSAFYLKFCVCCWKKRLLTTQQMIHCFYPPPNNLIDPPPLSYRNKKCNSTTKLKSEA